MTFVDRFRLFSLWNRVWIVHALLLALLAACSNSVMEEPQEPQEPEESQEPQEAETPADTVLPEVPAFALVKVDSAHPEMIRVSPNGATAVLGNDGPLAKANEKPRMRVKLDYDFSLGEHEVTCLEFKRLSDAEYWSVVPVCESDSAPVVGISFYDAILYANAYSRVNGYDTVYTYFKQLNDANGNCTYLEGLAFHPEVNGYRLPTEAEWVLAASVAWDPSQSWNATNAELKLHEVCGFRDSAGFCDLSGNVLELTNDWLGAFRDTTVVDYVGAPVGNVLREKVVKGGMVAQQPSDMNLYSRGDVYAVTASSIAGYIGFRLAFGAIPHATWMDNRGYASDGQASVRASSADIRQLVGTVRAKLAFRNDRTGNLAFVDYREGVVNAVEISDTLPVYHPDISPDGMKVAFCTGIEGVKGESALYVRNLDADGSGLVKLDVESAAIPRWYVDGRGDTSIIYVDDAGDNSGDAEFFSRATWKVPFSAGKFGKPKKLFDGAYHGGLSPDGRRAVSGAKRLRVNVDGRDEVWLDGAQACNASLSGDGTDRTLFLDFGSEPGRKFAGTRYGVHERLLVADSGGRIVAAVPAPSGYSFDHSEWAGWGNVAVVTLVNAGGAHKKIAAVNLDDSSVVELVAAEELWHPCLWVLANPASGGGLLDLDSAGVYRDIVYGPDERAMSLKMRMFWDMKDSVEMIAIGSSRTERAVDPSRMSMRSLNFGYVGGDMWATLYLADNYVVPHASHLKYLVFEISPDLMKNSRYTRMAAIFNQAPGFFYDMNHGFWKDGLPEGFVSVVDENVRYTAADSADYVNTRGLLKIESSGWGGEDPEILRDTVMLEYLNELFASSVDSLTAFIDSTADKGFKIIGLVYPQSPEYANTGAFGRHGVKRSLAMETFAYFDSLSRVYPHFILMDENQFGKHGYTDSMANDFDHLSAAGAVRLSDRLDSLLRTLGR